MEEAIVIDTPEGIHYARLAVEKGRVKMEKAGLKFKGGSARKRMALYFGMKPGTTHDVVVARIQEEMDKLIEAKRASEVKS